MTQKTALLTLLGVGAIGGSVAGGTYYLSQDKTIEDRLNKEGVGLIKETKSYQVAFKELKKNNIFITDIKTEANKVTNGSTLEDGGNALSAWCSEKIKQPLNIEGVEILIKKVKDYCGDRPLTIGNKLKGKLLTTGWDKKLEALKVSEAQKSTQLLEDLKAKDSGVTELALADKTKVEKALEDWCTENAAKELISDTDDTIFGKVENRCTNS